MINIKQRPSQKCAGETSLWISFPFNQQIIDKIKEGENAVWHDKLKIWEVPLSKLAFLIDNLTPLDDISISFLEDKTDEWLNPTIEYKVKPFKHQLEGIKWMINHNSGILGDVPGLGKTLTTIYSAEELKKQKGIEHCLIICGINTLKQNWKKEIQKCSNESCRIIGEKITKTGKVKYATIKERAEELYLPIDEFFVIINVESLRDELVVEAIKNSKNHFDMIVLDECHKVKDPKSIQSKGMLKIAKIAKYRYGLTGTLLINSPLDLFMPMKFIGHEKTSYTNFKNYYCEIGFQFGHQVILNYRNLEYLREELGSCSLRRTKDLLDLPPKIIIPEIIEMEENQSKFYNELREGIVKEADRVNIKNTSLLGLVVRLRQASTCPSTLSTNKNIHSCKIDRATELIDEIVSNGDKVVVFSTFKDPLYQIQSKLSHKSFLCTGDQKDEYVSECIDKFQNESEVKVFLGTAQKMATGVTLNAASYEIILDSPWTSADFEQMCDRIHRIGTKSTVMIYNLIAKDTIDERVWELVNDKKQMSDYILDGEVYNEADNLRYLLGVN